MLQSFSNLFRFKDPGKVSPGLLNTFRAFSVKDPSASEAGMDEETGTDGKKKEKSALVMSIISEEDF